MSLADKIKSARIQKNYTQEQAAEALLVSRQTISNWENEKSLPDIISIIKMSELYGFSLDEFLKGESALLKKIEKDAAAAKAERKMIKFAWASVAAGAILLVLGELFQGNPLIDFISGALPWVLLGLMMIFAALYLNEEKKDRE